MPSFCRHNRFIERCPICSKTLPGLTPSAAPSRSPKRTGSPAVKRSAHHERSIGVQRLRVRHETRLQDDGYRCDFVPGLRSSGDAAALARAIAFSAARLRLMRTDPPEVYARARAEGDIEQATWACFLATYISPLQDEDPFAGIRTALEQAGDWYSGALPDLDQIPFGPRTAHDPARGSSTLLAYRRWAQAAGSQAAAFTGAESWTPERRFQRIFERIALPGLGRFARYDLLVILGELGLYEMRADALHLIAAARPPADPTMLAAKRVFGIGDEANLERRARQLAEAIGVPIQTLDLALANWQESTPATLGFPEQASDEDVLALAQAALSL